MMTIYVCTAEISDQCTNHTVSGYRQTDIHGVWLCPNCRPFYRQPVRRSYSLVHITVEVGDVDKQGT